MSGGLATKHVKHEEEYTPSTAASIQTAQDSIAAFTASIAKLEKELEEAKVELKEWSTLVKQAIREGKTDAELDRLTQERDLAIKAVENAQTAVDKEKDRLQEEKKLLQEKEKLTAHSAVNREDAVLTIEEAYATLKVQLPDSVESFEPKLFTSKLDDSDPLYPLTESMRNAKVLGKFNDSSKPDFLLTEMFREHDEEAKRFRTLKVDGDELTSGGYTNIDTFATVLVIGTSGVGKTLHSYRLAKKEYTMLFVCSTESNAGSGDVGRIIRGACDLKKNGKSSQEVSNFVQDRMQNAMAFRIHIHKMCLEKYGEKFLPHHWAMAQLYPMQIFSRDIFEELQTLERVQSKITVTSIKYIVLDEAQFADGHLHNFFPGEKTGDNYRSLLSPFVRALVERNFRILICGTGLSASNLYNTTVSPIKDGVGMEMIGLSNYFEEQMVLDRLATWGISNEYVNQWAPIFLGRPRHATFLAESLVAGNVKTKIKDVREMYNKALTPTFSISAKLGQKSCDGSVNATGTATLHALLWNTALGWLLGDNGFIAKQTVLAIKFGVATLLEAEDQKMHCVVREPLLLKALLTLNPAACFEQYIQGGASEIGLSLEKYLGLMADNLLADLRKMLHTSCMPDEFKRDWQFSFPHDYTHQHGVRVQAAGGEIEWLQAARDHQKPLNTVCFPSTNMGPDLIVCARAADNPRDLLVVLIQAKSGVDESTPNAFRSLEKLYHENRNKSSAVPAKFQEYARIVKNILGECKVVHLVVKPVSRSTCASTEFSSQSDVVKIVLDKRDSAGKLFPTLAKGMACFRNAKLREVENKPVKG